MLSSFLLSTAVHSPPHVQAGPPRGRVLVTVLRRHLLEQCNAVVDVMGGAQFGAGHGQSACLRGRAVGGLSQHPGLGEVTF